MAFVVSPTPLKRWVMKWSTAISPCGHAVHRSQGGATRETCEPGTQPAGPERGRGREGVGAEASRKECRKGLPFAFIILSVSIGIASRVFQPPNAVPALTTHHA